MPKLNEIIGEEAFKALPDGVRNKYKDTDFVDSTGYVEKERFKQVNDSMSEYKKQVGERDKQLTELQGKVKDNEELTKEIENLKTANSTTAQEYEKKLEQMKFDTIVNNSLKDSKAKDIKLIRALLNNDKLKVSGEEVIGLKEQLESIRKDKDYLFEKEVPGTGRFETGGGKGGEPTVTHLGEKLAKQKAAVMTNTEEQNKFFK